MRIIDVRPDQEHEDSQAAQRTIEAEIAHPAKSIMIIVGDAPEIAMLADRSGLRSDPFPWREAIWMKVSRQAAERILGEARFAKWFPRPEICAVVLDFTDNVAERLDASASLFDVEAAFLSAKG